MSAEASGSGASPPAERAEGGSARALVVQSDRDEASVLAAWLRRRTDRVATAESGSEAVSVARSLVPDWIFVDDSLPDMSRYEFAHRVRSDEELTSTRLVALVDRGLPDAPEAFDRVLRRPLYGEQLDRLLGDGT